MDRSRAGIPGRPNLKRVHILTSALPQVFISFRILRLANVHQQWLSVHALLPSLSALS